MIHCFKLNINNSFFENNYFIKVLRFIRKLLCFIIFPILAALFFIHNKNEDCEWLCINIIKIIYLYNSSLLAALLTSCVKSK